MWHFVVPDMFSILWHRHAQHQKRNFSFLASRLTIGLKIGSRSRHASGAGEEKFGVAVSPENRPRLSLPEQVRGHFNLADAQTRNTHDSCPQHTCNPHATHTHTLNTDKHTTKVFNFRLSFPSFARWSTVSGWQFREHIFGARSRWAQDAPAASADRHSTTLTHAEALHHS